VARHLDRLEPESQGSPPDNGEEGQKRPATYAPANGPYGSRPGKCVQAVAMYGPQLRWKGEKGNGTTGRANDVQILVNQQARDITGCFKSTNQEELMPVSGLRPARSLLNNRGRQFALRMGHGIPSRGRDSSPGPRAKSANVWSHGWRI